MRLILTISLGLWVFSTSMLYGEPIRGASYIGMCNPHFPCDQALTVQPKAIGYLADAFGRKCDCLKRFLQEDSLKYVRVHISNGTCFPERNRSCGRYDIFRGESQRSAMIKILQDDIVIYRRFRRLLRATVKKLRSSGKEIRYSPMMESPFPWFVRKKLLREVERLVGKNRTVDSMVYGECLSGYICEKHGDNPKYANNEKCISDLDGITLFDANLDNLSRFAKQCEAIFYWTTGFNLLPLGYKGPFILPSRRTHKAFWWEFEGLRQCLKP